MKDTNTDILREIPIMPSTIEDIDFAMYDWINDNMNISITSKDSFKKVETIWVSAERAWLSKKSKESREKTGALVLPLITIERKGINKDLAKKGKAFGNVPLINDEKGGSDSITIARRINQDKTSNFVNNDMNQRFGQTNYPRKSKKIVYETMTIPMPVYIEVTYEIKMKALYQQQMNEMLQPFMTKTLGINYFVLKRNGHKYEAFMEADFNHDNNGSNMAQEERKYESSFNVKVLGYLIGGDKNEKQPKIIIRENAVEVRIPREHIVYGDKTIENKDYYGVGGLGSTKKSKRTI